MKRVIISNTIIGSSSFDALPESIEYQYNSRVRYTYKKKYVHEGDRDTHEGNEGMYYEVCAENGTPIEPWDLSSPVLTDLDVYLDGFVGYVWNGRLNALGHLEGSEVIKN